MATQSNQLNLANLFQTVAGSLATQQKSLNKADTVNHDHGDNMVEVFNVIAQAMQARQNADPADQLEYASQLLRQRKSGSAQVYAQGLAQASKEFQGQKQITGDNAINLIQALIGGGQSSTVQPQGGVGDLIGSLLGGSGMSNTQAQPGVGDLLGQLMGGGSAQGVSQGQQAGQGLDVGDLLNAGMAFMDTKSKGGSNLDAIVNALVSGSAMAGSSHRAQSGTLVANSLLQAIGQLTTSGSSATKKAGWSGKR